MFFFYFHILNLIFQWLKRKKYMYFANIYTYLCTTVIETPGSATSNKIFFLNISFEIFSPWGSNLSVDLVIISYNRYIGPVLPYQDMTIIIFTSHHYELNIIIITVIILFKVEEVIIKFTDDKEATEKMKECCPGAPFVLFSTKSGVKVDFVNPIPFTGLFSKYVTISDGDSYSKVIQRLSKDIKIIKSKWFFMGAKNVFFLTWFVNIMYNYLLVNFLVSLLKIYDKNVLFVYYYNLLLSKLQSTTVYLINMI